MATNIEITIPSSIEVDGNRGEKAQGAVQKIVQDIQSSRDFASTRSRLPGLADTSVKVATDKEAARSSTLVARFTPGSGVKGLTDEEIDAEVAKWTKQAQDSHKISGVSTTSIDSLGTEEQVRAAGCYCRWRRAC